jgi:hypothetical protein
MQINPYESPRGTEHQNHSQEKAKFDPALVSVFVVPIAGIVGGSVFIAIMEVMRSGMYSDGFFAGIFFGAVTAFIVLCGGDRCLHPHPPPYVSAVIGMLLSSPIAYIIAFGFGLMAYDLATQNRPGAWLMGLLIYFSFFSTLSLGGWLAIVRTR